MKNKGNNNKAASTEEKIRAAAKKVFLRKGFSAARTRDIAEEAGINLALLNYYFRSKKKLFDEVMQDKIQTLLETIIPVLNNPSSTLEEKINLVVINYIKVLSKNKDLPLFVLNELRKDNVSFVTRIPFEKVIMQSPFVVQLKKRRSDIHPLQFLISLMGLIIFPFVASPIFTQTGVLTEKSFEALMKEREKLIPLWMSAILNTK